MFVGNGEVLFEVLVPHLLKWTTETPLWCRICSNVFLSVPDTSLEPTIEQLLKKSQNVDLMTRLLGDSLLTKPKLKLLFTHKFLFSRTYENDGVPYCVLGYLASKSILFDFDAFDLGKMFVGLACDLF